EQARGEAEARGCRDRVGPWRPRGRCPEPSARLGRCCARLLRPVRALDENLYEFVKRLPLRLRKPRRWFRACCELNRGLVQLWVFQIREAGEDHEFACVELKHCGKLVDSSRRRRDILIALECHQLSEVDIRFLRELLHRESTRPSRKLDESPKDTRSLWCA